MTNTYKYDVFISYARNDGLKHAEALEAKLESAGYKTWRDKRQLDPHQDFTGMIEDAIENSRVIVGCITPDVRRHDSFVRRELQFGMIDNKPIVPLLLNKSAKLPIHIVNLTYIDFTMPTPQWDAPFMQLDSRLTDIKAGKWDSDALTPPEDSFREYCEALYKQIAKFLNQTVFSMLPAQSTDALITLKTDDSPDMVLEPMMQEANALPLQFFGMAGIELDDETPPFSDFAGAFDHYEGRVLLLGDPGSGKTTTLFAYARDAVSRRLDDPSAPLPILLPTIAWNAEQRPSLIDWVQSAIPAFKNKQAEIETLLNTGKALLLLDGLDELGDRREKKQGDQVIETYDPRPLFIDTMLTDANNQTVIDNQSVGEHPRVLPNHDKNKIVISCRVKDYNDIIVDNAKIPLNGAITLQPLDDTQLQTYLRDLPQLWDALQNDDDLRDVARTPLLLSLFSFTFADILKHEESTHLLDDLSTLEGGALRDRLFRAYIERRYAHEQRKYIMRGEKPPFSVEQIYEVLGHVAMVDACDRQDNRVLLNYFKEASIEEAQLDDFIDFMISLHLLVDGGMVKVRFLRKGSPFEEQSYRFIHLLLRDHLVYDYCIPRLGNNDLYSHFRTNPAKALGELGDTRTTESLIPQLKNADGMIRREVVSALAELGDARAVEPLIPLLQDENFEVRRNVAWALGKLGDARAVDPLVPLLQDDDAGVRQLIARALGKLRDVRAVEHLIPLLQGEDAEAVAWALGKLGDARAVDPLIPLLHDIRKGGRKNVAWALGELGDARAVEPLIPLLQDKSANMREKVAETLGKLGDARAVDPLVPLLQDDDAGVRQLVAEALGKLGDVRAVEPLVPLLNDQSKPLLDTKKINEYVGNALHKIGTPEALQALKINWKNLSFETLVNNLQSELSFIRASNAETLGKLGDVRAVDPLLPLLQDEDPNVRRTVAEALGNIGDVRAIEPLIPLVQDENEWVRRNVAEALGNIGDVRAVEPLFSLLRNQPGGFWKVNEYVREALEKIGTPEALQAIKEAEEAGWFDTNYHNLDFDIDDDDLFVDDWDDDN